MAVRKVDGTYYDVAKQRLSSPSRLNIYNILKLTETNQTFLNIFKNYVISEGVKDDNGYFEVHLALEDEWWDNISYEFYGTSQYWYLICEMNDIVNPYEELVAGQLVKVLKKSYLYDAFKGLSAIADL